jgi:thiamine biosynthesis protein ThiS
MTVQINGETRQIEDGTTVLALLESLSLKPQATVVQRNGDIVDRERYGDTGVSEGDVLELVRFVGGG